MTWHRFARTGLLVAGAVSVVGLFAMIRDRPDEAAPIVSLRPVDREADEDGGNVTSSRLSGSLENVRLSAGSYAKYGKDTPTPYTIFADAHLDFREDGIDIWADEAKVFDAGSAMSAPDVVELAGNVRIVTDDGLTLETPSANYAGTSGLVTMPGAITIVKGRMRSSGVGGYYDREHELFSIQDQAHVVVSATEDDPTSLDATSTMMTMAREEHFVRLEQQARIVRPDETLSADIATIYFVEGTETARLVDLRGGATVVPNAGAEAPPPEMRGDTIGMTFRPEARTLQQATLTGNAALTLRDGTGIKTVEGAWIDVTTAADGRSIATLAARERVVVRLPAASGSPARTIRGAMLSANGAEGQGLQSARFEGDVSFVEHTAGPTSPPARTGESRVMTLGLDGGFDSVRQAEFLDDVRFTADATRATAPRAVYDASGDRLELFAASGNAAGSSPPHAENDRMTIDARSIALALSGDDVSASGDVRTLIQPAPDSSGRPSALFSSETAVLGSSAEFEFDGATERATYRGTAEKPALLIQDGNEVSGQTLRVAQATGDLSAEGGVESVFILVDETAGAAAPSTTYRVEAEALTYVESARTATYTGAPVRLLSGDAESEAEQITLTVSDAEREVEVIEWTRAVYALLEKQYETAGSSLRYDVSSGSYRLEGAPAVTKLPTQDGECVRERGLVAIFNRRTNEKAWPPALNQRGKLDGVAWPCGRTIR